MVIESKRYKETVEENADRREEEAGKTEVKESDSPMEEPDCNDAKSKPEELIEKIKSGEKIPISIQILI